VKILSHIDLKNYWFKGKLHNPLQCKTSNFFKLFNLLNNKINSFIDLTNRYYDSLYPCLGEELIKEHEQELGIPDNIFNNVINTIGFTYAFPIPFINDSELKEYGSIEDRRKDIIVKKYLMQDNSELGFKRIGAIYGYPLKFETETTPINIGFTYTFPINFIENNIVVKNVGECEDDNEDELEPIQENCNFPYAYPINLCEIQTSSSSSTSCEFTYVFPILFDTDCEDEEQSEDNIKCVEYPYKECNEPIETDENCSFTYTFPIEFYEECENSDCPFIKTTVTITICNSPSSLDFLKLVSIFNFMKPLGVEFIINKSDEVDCYDIEPLKICNIGD